MNLLVFTGVERAMQPRSRICEEALKAGALVRLKLFDFVIELVTADLPQDGFARMFLA